MSSYVTCVKGHRFEPDMGREMICPQCGALVDLSSYFNDSDETFKPVDDLPPLPIPSPQASQARAPFQLAGYEILAELGRGGMGVVYKARQISLDRVVALKMILGNPSAEELRRFKTEADACAQLHHPNIVQIFEIGEREGQPYLALEFVDGGSLAARLAGAPAEPNAAAQLVEILARAIHFAHERKILHRDLKPANVLIAVDPKYIDLPWPVSAHVKIADFGLAKRLDRESGQTRSGSILGTPSYMAPEQASGDGADVASDVYALGAILYEMLTGRPPFRGVTALETLRQVLHEEPVPPRRLQPNVPLDLETICLKCLAKSPSQRYPIAEALAEDLVRFLAGKPILARPTPWHERTAKWIKRRPAVASLIVAASLAALLLVGLSVGLYYNAQLQKAFDETERLRYLGDMNQAQRFWNENDIPRMLTYLKAHESSKLRSFEWYYLNGLGRTALATYSEHAQPVTCIAHSPTDSLVASASTRDGQGEIHLWNSETRQRMGILRGHKGEIHGLAFSHDGKLLASGSSDKTVRLWRVAKGELVATLQHDSSVNCVAFRPDSEAIACGTRGDFQQKPSIVFWNTKTTEKTITLDHHREPILSVAFSPDGSRLLSGGGSVQKPDSGELFLWDLNKSEAIFHKETHGNAVTAVTFHPAGEPFATAGDDHAIRVWYGKKPAERQVLRGHRERVTALAINSKGTRLASGSLDRSALLWDTGSGEPIAFRQGHLDGVRGVTFNIAGDQLLSASSDMTVKIWKTDGAQDHAYMNHHVFVMDTALSPNGNWLATVDLNQKIHLWDVNGREIVQEIEGPAVARAVAIPFNTEEIARPWHVIAAGDDGVIRFFNLLHKKDVDPITLKDAKITTIAVSRDGSFLAAGVQSKQGEHSAIDLIDVQTRSVVHRVLGFSNRITSLAISPDGKMLAAASRDENRPIRIFDVASRAQIAAVDVENPGDVRIAFSPDGKRLAVTNGDLDRGRVRLHDTRTGNQLLELTGHSGMASALAFSPDGQRLATTDGKLGASARVKLWDVVTGREVLTLHGATGIVHALTFGDDGKRLVAAGGALGKAQPAGEIILWDAWSSASPQK